MNYIKILTCIVVGVGLLFSCKKEDDKSIGKVAFDPTPYNLSIADFPPPAIGPDNQLTVQGVKLGRMLFYEKKLSKDGSMSCATCHRQEHAFSDTVAFSIGVDGYPGKRQAMAVFNMVWNTNGFFWEGRAELLRHQSLMPIQDSLEMAETLENVVAKLKDETMYRNQFIRAFGSDEITSKKMSLALEQFMNSIVSVESKYDKFLRGDVELTQSEERGRFLFFEEHNEYFPQYSGADCAHCHVPKNFENDKYMNNGLDYGPAIVDFGRELVTGLESDRGKFKVPSLRNVEVTSPYMHDARFTNLLDVLDHYNSGLRKSATLDPTLANTMATGLELTTQDKNDLLAFLKTLTDTELLTNPAYANPF